MLKGNPMYKAIASGIVRKRLQQVIFDVTFRCNSRCRTCFNWNNTDSVKKDELTPAEIEKISKSMPKFLWFLASGGEPFLREDLPEICEIFYRNNHVKHFSIPTNSLLTGKIKTGMEKILENCPDASVNLVLSLDGLGEKHDEARGVKGNFEKFLKTFSLVGPLREKYPNLSVKVHTVITNKNYMDLDEIISYVKKLGPDIHTFDFVRGDVRNKEVALPPAQELKGIVERIKSTYRYYAGFKGMGIHSRLVQKFSKAVMLYYNDLFLKMLGSRKQVIPCYAGEMNAVIDPYGNVGFCELRGSFGNLRKANYDFSKLWNSFAADRQRAEIKAGKCSCYHPCYQFINIMFNPLELAAASRYLF